MGYTTGTVDEVVRTVEVGYISTEYTVPQPVIINIFPRMLQLSIILVFAIMEYWLLGF